MLKIAPLRPDHFGAAASLFAAEYCALRGGVPEVPEPFTEPAPVRERLAGMEGRSLAAFEGERLAGYLAWWQSEDFRRSGRRGAYVPEWGHSTLPEHRTEIYRALYRAASGQWAAAGLQVHAISLLAHDVVAREAWFWNGFGLAVIDAARSLAPLSPPVVSPLTVRRATPSDADALSSLDAEHTRHYAAPPVFMVPGATDTPDSFRNFLARPRNTIWLALAGDAPAGFMRFNGSEFDGVAMLESDRAAFCDGLYVRPAYRGRRAAAAMLAAAVDHYAALGLDALYTNFESFNPEAAAFWPRHFRPVCYSLMRVPESLSD